MALCRAFSFHEYLVSRAPGTGNMVFLPRPKENDDTL